MGILEDSFDRHLVDGELILCLRILERIVEASVQDAPPIRIYDKDTIPVQRCRSCGTAFAFQQHQSLSAEQHREYWKTNRPDSEKRKEFYPEFPLSDVTETPLPSPAGISNSMRIEVLRRALAIRGHRGALNRLQKIEKDLTSGGHDDGRIDVIIEVRFREHQKCPGCSWVQLVELDAPPDPLVQDGEEILPDPWFIPDDYSDLQP